MEYLTYGKTGLEISRLCFGAGRIKNTCNTIEAGSTLMLKALDEGVTFWDTAEGVRDATASRRRSPTDSQR